ncbi:MAG TPA: TadE/TadG family type IV pilus assembly protein [Stellaceae bacterium]|nr:TadE/TadG family type IV pilus assembly protein [Stellaceae bacterium]
MMMRTLRQWLQCRRGAVAVEFVIVAPIIFLTLVGFVDFGMLTFQKMQVDYAAQAGARYALEYGWDTSNPGTAISNVVTSATALKSAITATPAPSTYCGCAGASGSLTVGACGTNCPSSGFPPGTYVQVNAQSSYSFIVAWPGMTNPLPMSASQTVRVN